MHAYVCSFPVKLQKRPRVSSNSQVRSFLLVVCIIQRGSWLISSTWHFQPRFCFQLTACSAKHLGSISNGSIDGVYYADDEYKTWNVSDACYREQKLANSTYHILFHLFHRVDVSRNDKILRQISAQPVSTYSHLAIDMRSLRKLRIVYVALEFCIVIFFILDRT